MSMLTDEIRAQILSCLADCLPQKTIDPTQIARNLAGKDEKKWRLLMKPIRQEAVFLAKQGKLHILRKTKIVDPDDFKGLYRLAPIGPHSEPET